ncbi:MAG TPA: PPC domain-containing protein [Pirellulales bacterium]|nr:PPC domain-containing protein [Pirellulales bacterium]
MAVLAWLVCGATAAAQLPGARLSSVFPAGGRQGDSAEIAIAGGDLDSVDRLLFSHPGIAAQPKLREAGEFENSPQPIPNQFTVQIGAETPPGYYEVRALGKYGVSNPRAFFVGVAAEVLEAEPNETIETAQEVPLDSVVNGRSNRGSDLDFYRFTAKAGQRVLIECRARAIDSRLDAALAVYDAAGRELASKYEGSLRDTLIDFTVPADGSYTVKLHDFIYGGGDEYVYRLSLSTQPHIDFVFPPAGVPGGKWLFRVYGRNLPGGKPAPGVTVDGKPLEVVAEAIELPAGPATTALPVETLIEPNEAALDAAAYRLQTSHGPTEPLLIGFASAPIVAEEEPNDDPQKAQQVSAPCECVGQFSPQGDQDWFSFGAKQGDKYVIEVISQRQGSIADPFLLVEQLTTDKQGQQQVKELKSEDDAGEAAADPDFNTRHDDPIYRFTAPADGSYRVLVRDLYFGSRGDPRFVYRLAIRPEQPDFRLVAMPKFSGSQPNQQQSVVWNPLLRKGGTESIELVVFRRDGFDGEIAVSAEDLPAGVTAQPISIGPADNLATLVLKAADDAPASVATFRVVGRSKVGDAELVREARAGSLVWAGQQRRSTAHARLTSSLTLAVSDTEQAPFLVEAKDGGNLEMSRAGKLEIPLKVTRRDGFSGPIQMSVSGLPRGFQRVNNLTVASKADSFELTMNIPANSPLGSFSFYLRATAKHNYRRNPEAADAATKRKDELAKRATELALAAKDAAKAKQDAEKVAAELEQKAEAAAKRLAEAAEAAETAESNIKAASADVEAAKQAAEDKPDDKELAAALAEAEKRLNEAETEAEKAAEAKTAAEKSAEETSLEAKAAAQTQTAAEQTLAAAEANAKSAEKAKTAAEKEAVQAAGAAKPKSLNIGFPSTTITLKVTPAPMTLMAPPPSAPLAQGAKLELPIQINRLYGYADPVQLSVTFPKGVAGLKAAAVTIPKDGTEAKLVLEATASATPGEHELTIQAVSRFNNQNLTTTELVRLAVQEAKKP